VRSSLNKPRVYTADITGYKTQLGTVMTNDFCSPYLQLDFLAIQLDSSDFEINSWQQGRRETSSDLQ